jgi:hypothetical protein
MNGVDIQFKMPLDRLRELENLMRVLGLRTREEVFDHGLRILAWAVSERTAGSIILSHDVKTGSNTELELPILEVISID